MILKNKKEMSRKQETVASLSGKLDFAYIYGKLPRYGQFMKHTLLQVEQDPLLGEKDRWKLAGNLRRMDRNVPYSNGEPPLEHVSKVHAEIARARLGSEEEALGMDPFIKRHILENPGLSGEIRLDLARRAAKARQSQEHLTLHEEIDKEILKNVSRAESSTGDESLNSGFSLWRDHPDLGGRGREAPARPASRNRVLATSGNRIGRDQDADHAPRETQRANRTRAALRRPASLSDE